MRERQTLEFQKLTYRRLIGAAVATAAMAAAGLAGSAAASADAATTPDLQTLTYTSTGPGGDLYDPGGSAVDANGDVFIADINNSKIAEVTGLAQPGNAAGPSAARS
jgi:ABC-type glycerol-3-phosphate transport system substrate-binding protein